MTESPAFVGRAVVALAQDPDVSRWNGKSLSSGQLARVYGFTDLDGSQPDAWRYVPEVQDAGRPADTTRDRGRAGVRRGGRGWAAGGRRAAGGGQSLAPRGATGPTPAASGRRLRRPRRA